MDCYNKTIILCSHSPRRKEILELMGFKPQIYTIDIEEKYPDNLSPESISSYIANKKFLACCDKMKDDEIWICADTIVILNDKIMGKPKNIQQAKSFLEQLSDQTHKVITGVCLGNQNDTLSFSDTTMVTFKSLSDEQINYYLKNYTVLDKAGAYAIQEWIGLTGIEKIEGDYYNVMGLPANKVFSAIKELCQ